MVTYDELPDPDRYAEHAELCSRVPGGEFSHGPVFGSPMGEPAFAYAAEWRFPDMEAFKAAAPHQATRADVRKAFSHLVISQKVMD